MNPVRNRSAGSSATTASGRSVSNGMNDRFFVTTAIPYVNAEPHIGHAMDFVIADVLARYHRAHGKTVLFSTGTDEHGAKILEKAQEVGQEPQVFTDQLSKNYIALLGALNVQYDRFIRTTDPKHAKVAQTIWKQIEEHIYKDKYKGWYCVGCEAFVPAAEAITNNFICPDHNRPYEELEEENYFFEITKFTEQLKALIKSDQYHVFPETRKHEILSLFEDGLTDISISRPKSKIPWGIPVPGDDDQVIYVWFEALINYISVLGYPDHDDFKTFWPADVHVIGKDIIRFHAAIWPAMLLAARLPLPKNLYVHGHITSAGKKMSKSLGNVVNPFSAAEQFGPDALRYFILSQIPSGEDGDFSWDRFSSIYESHLADDLGNLVQRVATMVSKYQGGKTGDLPAPSHDVKQFHEAVESFRFDKALSFAWGLIRGLNEYIEQEKPWQLAKNGDTKHLTEVLQYLVANIGEIAVLLAPFLPTTSEKIIATFAGHVVHPEVGVLFPKLEKK